MTPDHPAIRVDHLGKQYRLGGPKEQYLTFRDAIVNTLKTPVKAFHPPKSNEMFWALKDVSFEVEQGDVVGIIGRNGAGKSTLLKILSRITTPTEGTVELHGRVGSLLEVGTGFHPEMTGRENIFLNGSILGMKKTEIDDKFEEIVKFSEIEKFLDTPVKRYSSGMYVRLAFAVAAHLEPEILLVDEVLAVGDAQFQKKCLGKMGEVAKEGRTVLFVSHNMQAISSLCNKTMLIQNGGIRDFGITNDIINQYLNPVNASTFKPLMWMSSQPYTLPCSSTVIIKRFSIHNHEGSVVQGLLKNSENYYVEIEIELLENNPLLIFSLLYYSDQGQILFTTDIHDFGGIDFGNIKTGVLTLKIPIPVDFFVHNVAYEVELISVIHNVAWILRPGNETKLKFDFFRDSSSNPFNYEKYLAPINPKIKWEVIQ